MRFNYSQCGNGGQVHELYGHAHFGDLRWLNVKDACSHSSGSLHPFGFTLKQKSDSECTQSDSYGPDPTGLL